MVRIVYFILLAFSTLNLFAQQPNDCANAIIVCGNANFSSNASGIGTIQEVAGCGGFEHNSIWTQLVSKIPWRHTNEIFSKLKEGDCTLSYI